MVRSFLKKQYFGLTALIGADAIFRRRLVSEEKAAVLNLHRIRPEPSPYWPPLHPRLFEALLRYLDTHFEVRSINDLHEKQGNRPVAVLSFDDGYYDFIEYALPILRKYKIRANMNIIPQCVETGLPIWNVRLYDFLDGAAPEEISEIDIAGFAVKFTDSGMEAKLRYGMALSRFLKTRPRAERIKLFRPIEDLMARKQISFTRMMNTDEVRQIASDVDLGAHSYSHESMEFEEDAFFESDVEKCREFFYSHLQRPMDIYAFPNGSYRRGQIEYLREKGVGHVLLVDEKPANLGSSVIPRITMYGNSPAELRIRAVGAAW